MTNATTHYQKVYDTFVDELKTQSNVLALILAGSRARGIETNQSDTDVFIIMQDGCSPQEIQRVRRECYRRFGTLLKLDLVHRSIMTLREFESFGAYEPNFNMCRYAVVNVKLEFDQSKGRVGTLLRAKQRLNECEKEIGIRRFVPTYFNKAYRSIQSALNGDTFSAHLDSAGTIDLVIGALFALHGRVPPYNKYLVWELNQSPLEMVQTDALLEGLHRIATRGSVADQQRILRQLIQLTSDQGYGHFVDSWHGKLATVL